MFRFVRRSLLFQLLGVYLAFVAVVIGAGTGVNAILQGQLLSQVQAADMALAQQIATETSIQFDDAKSSLDALAQLDVVREGRPNAMIGAFKAVTAARPDLDHVYWIDPFGALLVSIPSEPSAVGAEFEPPDIVQRALRTSGRVFDVGLVYHGTFTADVIFAESVRDRSDQLVGILAVSLALDDLSEPLASVVRTQARQGRHLMISIVDARGELIATPDPTHLLDSMLGELPGADQALQGHPSTTIGPGPDGHDYLFTVVPVPDAGWAVAVRRPASEALAVITQLHFGLLGAVLLFAVAGLVFWLMLLDRVIQPMHALAVHHQAVPDPKRLRPSATAALAQRDDEVGGLARSLDRLEHDVLSQLTELHTLLETSNAVVRSLDPRSVVGTIIREVRRLVDVQAAAVFVPDEHGILRVLVSDGHGEDYERGVSVPTDDPSYPAARALRESRPIQTIAAPGQPYPPLSYAEGFRAVLALPIISRHAGAVVLLVHRTEPQPFTDDEINLLLIFTNYAALAWEHAVLYERSDERLREIAAENARLYQETNAEKQRLDAIMGSMSDGLILTSADGAVLYANPGAATLTGIPVATLVQGHIRDIHAALRSAAIDPASYDAARARTASGQPADWVIETTSSLAIHLRLFDVHDERGETIGRGLLLRDITREREIDEFKTTLLAAVGHEVRTPLAAIKGHASTLLQDDVVWSPDDQRKSLLTISDEADRLADLVRDLLDLSRQQAGLLPLHRRPTRLAALVDGALHRHGPSLPEVSVDLPADLPPLDVDQTRIEVALRNVLANALAYGGGHVRVRGAVRDDMVEVAVSDDGPGITPDELPHLFERFYRAPRGLERRSQGTGLGLAICKAFVEAHGGSVSANSGPQGTTILLLLPIARRVTPLNASREHGTES
ncbi:MAG TPA: ATP-binding protein [Ktedonobacterales bacterium]